LRSATRAAASLDDLLASADAVSLHVPETAATKWMIGAKQLAAMRPGALLLNASRGTVVDIDALAESLRGGHLAGAAVDVFPVEPQGNDDAFESPLRGMDNVILTPHIGGSTLEAQDNIGIEVASKLVRYSDNGSTLSAVNFPEVSLPEHPRSRRLLHIHRNVPGVMSRINEIFSSGNINIDAQFLQTDAEVGYVVIDVAADRAAGRADQRSSRADTGHAAGAGAVLATDRRSRSLLTLAHVTTGATMPTKTARRRTGSVGAIERHAHGGYERLLRAAQALPAIRVAVAHPCSSEALQAAIESRDEGLIEPILVGRARASTRSRSKPASRWPVSSASTPSTAPPRLPRQCGLRARATPPP
jgi:hypothetical protein